MNLFFK